MTICDILPSVRLGTPIIIFDDLKEGEGDLFVAAQCATAESIQFMIRRAGGLLCMAMPRERLESIGLPRVSDLIRAHYQAGFRAAIADTPFHLPVDLRRHHSGVSVAERLETVQSLLNSAARMEWFSIPGHLMTLGAHPKLLEGRRGHTEASVTLSRMAGLQPASLLCEIVDDEGEMCQGDDLVLFAKENRITVVYLSEIILAT